MITKSMLLDMREEDFRHLMEAHRADAARLAYDTADAARQLQAVDAVRYWEKRAREFHEMAKA